MNKSLPTLLALSALLCNAFAVEYKETKDWVRLPDVRSQPTNQHGDVAVSSKGEVYVSTMDPKAGVMVFASDGRFLRNVPDAPNDFHGFVIRKDKGGEFIYGPRLVEQSIVKMTLDGKVVFTIPASAIPDQFKNRVPKNTKKNAQGEVTTNPDEGKAFVRLTGMDIAPNGVVFTANGDVLVSEYSLFGRVHRFNRQ